ncbi:hypothetical protein GCM10009691_01020 [Brevibacterium picturae]|uniref:Uncharacterized protein n=1 Tax=Brevibacterium picturae TaxID=260553 RepID=A0ABP4LRP2_9MICO
MIRSPGIVDDAAIRHRIDAVDGEELLCGVEQHLARSVTLASHSPYSFILKWLTTRTPCRDISGLTTSASIALTLANLCRFHNSKSRVLK